jgi:hypothetical protein
MALASFLSNVIYQTRPRRLLAINQTNATKCSESVNKDEDSVRARGGAETEKHCHTLFLKRSGISTGICFIIH